MDVLERSVSFKGQFIILLVFTYFIFVSISSNELHYQNQIDEQALLELKRSVELDPTHSLSNWVNGNNICNWTGITCNVNQRVVSVVLKYRGLFGTIPPHIGNLSFLTMLDLSHNYFSAQIPQELGKLQNLHYIKLYENNLLGSIPVGLCRCTNLLELRLNNNLLSGSVPPELSSLHYLKKLDISFNKLGGFIPHGLANCTGLKVLDLGHNLLKGSIPRSMSNCTKLRVLSLSWNALEGPIPSEIFKGLTRLQYLDLRSNKLNGSISMEIGKQWRLKVIALPNNSITGTIPMALANCSSLERLDFSHNSLYGTVPPELGSLSRLQELGVANNSIGGSIYFLTNCTGLEILVVGSNKIEGTIPEALGFKLPKLQALDLIDNQLTGTIPKSIGNCTALYFFSVNVNKLSGTIPEELGMLTHLQTLELGVNRFEGNIFPLLLNLTQLQWLSLAFNRFVGSIPGDIGLKLPNLQRFYVGYNQFTGGIPKSLGNCSQLSVLDLEENLLTGVMPQELGMLTALQLLSLGGNSVSNGHSPTFSVLDVLSNCSVLDTLDLQENEFSGKLSRGIGNLSPRLSVLVMDVNDITGNIPEEIGNLTELYFFGLGYNNVVGQLPSALGLLKNLQALYLSSNKLQGSIPSEFKMLVSLEYLFLNVNNISGEIPSQLGSLQQLRKLDLSHNELRGRIPNAIGKCFRLEMIDLSYNNLTENIPTEISSLRSLAFYLNFSHNSLTGRLPSLGMQQVQAVDISANKLSGPIPGDIGSCSGLKYLNLAKNKLDGMVPKSIGQLKSLKSIDISFNELSGPVPPSIANLTMLGHLNFSYNNLNGSVPNEGAFRNLSATSFLANPKLCAASGWLNLPNCTSYDKMHDALNINIVLGASIGTVFVLCCILGAFYIFYRRNKRAPMANRLLGEGFMQISSQELHTATQGFSPDNLLGTGSFGSVYKGLLSDNKLVAIKLFDQDPQNSYKHFVRECRVLRKIRHRNLVKVLSSSSAGDLRALVLEFMPQGSLEQHLHKDETGMCTLSLKTMVKIAFDVAHGMAYLHHDCFPPVVHCDLKPSNVLMDETMTAHVADFGISRLLTTPVSASSSTSRLKGTVGYLAPEYGLGGEVSTKGDVYSFGMLILEMVTKRRPTDSMFSEDNTLPRWVRRAFPEAVEEVVDKEVLPESSNGATPETTGEELESSEHGRFLLNFIGLGVQCTKENPAERPTMREVEVMLEKMVHGRAYGNLGEHSSLQNLLTAGNEAGHPNGSTDESESG